MRVRHTNDSWSVLRNDAPLFSYSLIFQPRKQRLLFSDMILLALECEYICAQTSETMLALVRLQWWLDNLGSLSDPQGPPLLWRLRGHCRTSPELAGKLAAIVEQWRDEIHTDHDADRGQNSWAGVVSILAELSGHGTSALPGIIGQAVYASRYKHPLPSMPSTKTVRDELGPGGDYLAVLAFLARYGARRQIADDPLILFKIIWYIYIRPET